MSKQSENKRKQGFRKDAPCCSNCMNFTSNLRCSIGGFAVIKSNWCQKHRFKIELTEETKTLCCLWKHSIQLDGLYTIDEAQEACPAGYRLPTREEQEWLIKNSKYHFDFETKEGVFRLPDGFELRLPAAGIRNGNGDSGYQGALGYYWSSSPSGTPVTSVYFNGGAAAVNAYDRVYAFSVRCVPINVK